jgi:hypothetical protein
MTSPFFLPFPALLEKKHPMPYTIREILKGINGVELVFPVGTGCIASWNLFLKALEFVGRLGLP